MKRKKIIFFSSLFLSQAIILIASWMAHYYPGSISYIVHFVSLSFFLFFAVALYFLFGREIFRDAKLEASLYTMSQQQRLKETHIEEINRLRSDTELFQQHAKENLKFLRTQLLAGDYERSVEYFQEISLAFQEVSFHPPCSDSLLNAILECKRQYAREHKIQVHYRILLPGQYEMISPSLSCIFFNLLDNGIESCIRSGSTSAHLSLATNYTEDWLTIHMKNTKKTSEAFAGPTTKEDIYAHGFGLGIIEEIVDNSDGFYEWMDHGDIFESTIMLKYTNFTCKS